MADYFQYGEKQMAYLRRRDKRLGQVIDKIGKVERTVIPDLFAALVHAIVGQQISSKAQATVWARFRAGLGQVTPQAVAATTPDALQRLGISLKKATYIHNAALKVVRGELDMEALAAMDDKQVCDRLTQLDGIGVWSAQMLMLFSMQRPDILSYDDLAIRRGLCRLHRLHEIDRAAFERYRRRYSPCGSVASLYLWAVAGGALPAIRVQRYHSPVGEMLLGAYNDKLCLCDWDLPGRGQRTERRLSGRLQADYEMGSSSVVKAAAKQLDAYFGGGRKALGVPLLPVGTPFQQRVWRALQAVPYGQTITYKQLALRLGCPHAVRAVAASVGANALSLFIPCHRITGSGGALVGYAGGLEAKRRLLRLEREVSAL